MCINNPIVSCRQHKERMKVTPYLTTSSSISMCNSECISSTVQFIFCMSATQLEHLMLHPCWAERPATRFPLGQDSVSEAWALTFCPSANRLWSREGGNKLGLDKHSRLKWGAQGCSSTCFHTLGKIRQTGQEMLRKSTLLWPQEPHAWWPEWTG